LMGQDKSGLLPVGHVAIPADDFQGSGVL
jgi:hypothetical protein